jgi:hypothetical protein
MEEEPHGFAEATIKEVDVGSLFFEVGEVGIIAAANTGLFMDVDITWVFVVLGVATIGATIEVVVAITVGRDASSTLQYGV